MAEPNILSLTSILGKTAAMAVTTSATAILTVASGHVAKCETLQVSNIDGTNSCHVTVEHYRSSTARRLVYQLTIPAGTTLDVLSGPLWLQENDALRLTAQNNSDLEAALSYVDMS